MKTQAGNRRGLPKFDTTAWLCVGIVASAALFAGNLWSAIARWHEPLFPFKLGKIASMVIGIGLTIHCVDMIVYHRRRRSL